MKKSTSLKATQLFECCALCIWVSCTSTEMLVKMEAVASGKIRWNFFAIKRPLYQTIPLDLSGSEV